MSNNLSVKITADVAELQTKFGIAKAESAALGAELSKLNRAAAAGNLSILPGAMQQLVGDFAAAKTQASSLGLALGQASGGVLGITGSLEQSHGSISTATREFRALFDELSSGRTRQTPGTIAILAQRVFGLGPAALGAVAGVGILAGGLAYLAVKGTEAAKALDQAFLGAQFAGNLDISKEALKQFTDEMATAGNISASDAQKIAATLASIPGITTPIFHELTAEMSDLVALTGKDGPKIAEELAKAFSSKTSAEDYVRTLGGATQAQIDMAISADRSGSALNQQEAKFQALLPTIERSATTIDQQKTALTSNIGEFLKYAGAMSEGTSIEEIQTNILEESNRARQKQIEILKQSAAALSNTQQSPDQALQGGLKIVKGENPMALQIAEAQAKVSALESDLQQVQGTASKANLNLLNAGLTKARENLEALQFGPALEKMRSDMAQVAATWDGTQSGMLAKQIQIAQAELASVQSSEKQKLAVKTEIAQLEVRLRQTTAGETIAAARAEVSAIAADTTRSAVQRMEAERDVWQQTLVTLRQGTAQYTEAERALNADIVAISRERASQAAAIARSDAQTDIAISRMAIEAKKSLLDQDLAANATSVAQKLAMLRQLSASEFSLDDQALENELTNLQQGTAEYERVYNEIRELKAKLVADLAKLDQQAAADAKRAAQQEVTARKMATSEILNAESSLVGGLIGRRQSLRQTIGQIGTQMVQQEITNDLKAMTMRILIQDQGEAKTKASMQGGLLYHGFIELQKLLASIKSQSGQTAAQVAGDTQRVAAQGTAAAASKVISKETGGSTVMADAAKAFSGTYAGVAQIPYVGYILAPPAAAAAYAAVMAYEGMASLDVGTNYVPRDQLAMIHQGEAVIPKAYNPAAGGGGQGEGGDGGHHEQHNYNGAIHMSALDTKGFRGLINQPGNRRQLVQSARTYFARGGGRR